MIEVGIFKRQIMIYCGFYVGFWRDLNELIEKYEFRKMVWRFGRGFESFIREFFFLKQSGNIYLF